MVVNGLNDALLTFILVTGLVCCCGCRRGHCFWDASKYIHGSLLRVVTITSEANDESNWLLRLCRSEETGGSTREHVVITRRVTCWVLVNDDQEDRLFALPAAAARAPVKAMGCGRGVCSGDFIKVTSFPRNNEPVGSSLRHNGDPTTAVCGAALGRYLGAQKMDNKLPKSKRHLLRHASHDALLANNNPRVHCSVLVIA